LLVDYPEDSAEQLAERLAALSGRDRPFAAANVRQQVKRLRHKLAELLVAEVRSTLVEPTPERVEEELIEMGVMPYVRRFLPPDWRSRGELDGPG
jgi:hypothetical protein